MMRNAIAFNSAPGQVRDANEVAIFTSDGEPDAEELYLAAFYYYTRKENKENLELVLKRLANGGNA